jgi:hypothetical protein
MIKCSAARRHCASIANVCAGIFAKQIVAGSEIVREKVRKFGVVNSERS